MSDAAFTTVRPAKFPQDLDVVKGLITAYTGSLGIDLSFQNYQHEFASLPGKYSHKHGGALLLAVHTTNAINPTIPPTEEVIGCACLRALDSQDACELKRLYVTPEGRGAGAGKKLMDSMVNEAKTLGYKEMLLDTLEHMTVARKMYAVYGFEECEKYYNNPIAGAVFMRMTLQ